MFKTSESEGEHEQEQSLSISHGNAVRKILLHPSFYRRGRDATSTFTGVRARPTESPRKMAVIPAPDIPAPTKISFLITTEPPRKRK